MEIFNEVYLDFEAKFSVLNEEEKDKVQEYYFKYCREQKIHAKFFRILIKHPVKQESTLTYLANNISYFSDRVKLFSLEHELIKSDYFLNPLFLNKIKKIMITYSGQFVIDSTKIYFNNPIIMIRNIFENFFSSENPNSKEKFNKSLSVFEQSLEDTYRSSPLMQSVYRVKKTDIIFTCLDILKEKIPHVFSETIFNIDGNSENNIFTTGDIKIVQYYLDNISTYHLNKNDWNFLNKCAFVMSYNVEDYKKTLTFIQKNTGQLLSEIIDISLSLEDVKEHPLFASLIFNRYKMYSLYARQGIKLNDMLYTESKPYSYTQEKEKIDFILFESVERLMAIQKMIINYTLIFIRDGIKISRTVNGEKQNYKLHDLSKAYDFLFKQLITELSKNNMRMDLNFIFNNALHENKYRFCVFPENKEILLELIQNWGFGNIDMDIITNKWYHGSLDTPESKAEFIEKIRELQIKCQQDLLSQKSSAPLTQPTKSRI